MVLSEKNLNLILRPRVYYYMIVTRNIVRNRPSWPNADIQARLWQFSRSLRAHSEDSSKTLHVGGHARIDVDRVKRTGFPEVIFGSGKSNDQISSIMNAMIEHRETHGAEEGPYQHPIVASRVTMAQYEYIKTHFHGECSYVEDARLIIASSSFDASDEKGNKEYLEGRKVAVMCAGSSDLAVAEEAACMLRLSGVRESNIVRVYDVGVAGIYRLLDASSHLEKNGGVDYIIAVAGMDGAMPSALAGLVKAPIIAVPTSVGYGAAFGGLAPLLSMLNSCAPGVSLVNIDNGLGAAAAVIKGLRNSTSRR